MTNIKPNAILYQASTPFSTQPVVLLLLLCNTPQFSTSCSFHFTFWFSWFFPQNDQTPKVYQRHQCADLPTMIHCCQEVPGKCRIRRVPSIIPSLRAQKLGSRWQTPKHAWTDLVWMPTTPLLPWPETSLPSWSFRFPWCSFCVRRHFWMGLESGSNSHGWWVVGHLGQHGKDSVRWMAVSLKS